MIHIEQNQQILENSELKVFSQTGDYEDSALIEFYSTDNPNIISGAFQAQYVKYGGLVYSFSDHKALGEAILLIDPTSTHTAASYVRMTDDLLSQMESGLLEPDSLTQVLQDEKTNMQEIINKDSTNISSEDTQSANTTTVDTSSSDSTPTDSTTVDLQPDTITSDDPIIPEQNQISNINEVSVPSSGTVPAPVILEPVSQPQDPTISTIFKNNKRKVV